MALSCTGADLECPVNSYAYYPTPSANGTCLPCPPASTAPAGSDSEEDCVCSLGTMKQPINATDSEFVSSCDDVD
eukprot:975773-Rhodomonas_salina.1